VYAAKEKKGAVRVNGLAFTLDFLAGIWNKWRIGGEVTLGPFMKRAEVLVLIGVLTLLRAEARAVIGYVNVAFEPGDNWFGNPLQYTNQLDLLIPTAPDGSTVSLWDSTADRFDSTATFDHGTWSTNLTLNPGTGALFHTPSLFTNTFVGIVLNFDGTPYSGSLTEPPPFAGANGIYLFSSKAPVALSGHVFDPVNGKLSVFEAIMGRAPNTGEQVTTLDPLTQTYTTTTFLGGVWNNGDPSLAPGEAAMFNIGPVPEPSVLALSAIGTCGLAIARHRRGLLRRAA
jgi:hypothetical protein